MTGIRISGGSFRGRVVKAPSGVRPTPSRVRQALMSIWSARLRGACFLELFAGSGSVGVEALSRGARELVWMDSNPEVLAQLKKTRQTLDLGEGEAKVERANLPDALTGRLVSRRTEHDLIFADPPYAFDRYGELLEAAAHWLAPTGEMAVEHDCRRVMPERTGMLSRVDERRFGDSCLSFYRRQTGS